MFVKGQKIKCLYSYRTYGIKKGEVFEVVRTRYNSTYVEFFNNREEFEVVEDES